MQYEEKRRSVRIDVSLPLRYQLRGVQKYGNTLTKNISATGASFLADDFIKPDTNLSLEISIAKRSISATGAVRWASAVPRFDKYQVGLEFKEIDPRDRAFISDYVLGYMRDQIIERSN